MLQVLLQRVVVPELPLAKIAVRAGVVSGRLLEMLLQRATGLERLLAEGTVRHFATNVKRACGARWTKDLVT